MKKIITILGVRIDNFNRLEIEEKLANYIDTNEQRHIVTVNPEIILKAYYQKAYGEILNGADMNVCDGFGLMLAAFARREKLKHRWAGADLMEYLLGQAEKKKLRVLAVIRKNSLSNPQEIRKAVKEKYPGISVDAEYFSNDSFFENALVRTAEIILVGFGAPDQEKFILNHKKKFPRAKILVGIGGSFDFLTGKIKRAPKPLRKIGLEWMWRLKKEPKRIKRIINAVLVFPALAIFNERK